MSDLFLSDDDPPPPKGRPRWVDALGLAAIVAGMIAIGVLGDRGSADDRAGNPTTTTTLRPPRRIPYSSTSTLPTTTTTLPAPQTLGPLHDTETDTVLLIDGAGLPQVVDVDTGAVRRVPRIQSDYPPHPIPGGFLFPTPNRLEVLGIDADEPTPLKVSALVNARPMGVTEAGIWMHSDDGLHEVGFDGGLTGRRHEIPGTAYPSVVLDGGIVVEQFGSLTFIGHDGDIRPLGHGVVWGGGGNAVLRVSCAALQCSLDIIVPATGEERRVRQLDGLSHHQERSQFSADGRWFAYKSYEPDMTQLVVVDLQRARATVLPDSEFVSAFAFARRGDALFVAVGEVLRLYDPATGEWEAVEGIDVTGATSITATSR